MEVLLFAIVASALLAIYFAPTIVAAYAKHRNGTAIFVLNLFAGWTFVGWLVALVWAFTEKPESNPDARQVPSSGPRTTTLCDNCNRSATGVVNVGGRWLCVSCAPIAPPPPAAQAPTQPTHCESCGEPDKLLTRIDSGQYVCWQCLVELENAQCRLSEVILSHPGVCPKSAP